MIDYRLLFKMDKKHEVHKAIDKSVFFKKSNFTKKEKEKISKYIDELEIVYDIKYSDNSDFIVIGGSLSSIEDLYTVKTVSNIIASSIPYACLVALSYPSYDETFYSVNAFFKYDNTKNPNRSNVYKMRSLSLIVDLENGFIPKIFSDIAFTIEKALNANMAEYNCFKLIDDNTITISDFIK